MPSRVTQAAWCGGEKQTPSRSVIRDANSAPLQWQKLGDGFDDHRDALAAADTGAGYAVAGVATAQFEQKGEH